MWTRRSTFRVSAWMAVLAFVLAAMPAGSIAGANAPSATNREAVLKIGVDFSNPVQLPIFDPTKASGGGSNSAYDFYVYGTLLRPMLDGRYEPALAQSAEIVDASTIAVTLRPNLKFQDGTALNADAVKFNILRHRDSKTAVLRPALKKVAAIDVTSATELTIRLSEPSAGSFYPLLADLDTVPLSPTAVNAGKDLGQEPVGGGPFRFVSRDNQRIVLEKWDGYYAANKVKLDRIELINTSVNSMVVAYRTETIDFGAQVTRDVIDQLGGAPVKVATLTDTASPQFFFLQLQCNGFPDLFGDVRVRQALNYATDRKALNDLVNPGGEIMTQFAAKDSRFYTRGLAKLYPYDVDKAKRLLAEAGKSNLRLTLFNNTARPTAVRVGEVLQQQWAKAGITLELVGSANQVQEFYVTPKINALPQPGVPRSYLDYVTVFWDKVSLAGVCIPQDPSFPKDFAAFLATSATSDEGVELYKAIQRTVLKEALVVPIFIVPTLQAWNERFRSFTLRQAGTLLLPDFIGTRIGGK